MRGSLTLRKRFNACIGRLSCRPTSRCSNWFANLSDLWPQRKKRRPSIEPDTAVRVRVPHLTALAHDLIVESVAEVAELADALGSGPSGLTMPVEVQVLSSAL